MRDYRDATVIKIDSSATYYEYTVETAKDGYVVRSPRRLVLAEGSHVKVAIAGEYVYLTDARGKAHHGRVAVPPSGTASSEENCGLV